MVLNYDKEKEKEIIGLYKKYIRGRVLDVGCNEGKIAALIEGEYIGIDNDGAALSKAKLKGLKVKKVDLNKNKIPFKNDSFDSILALDIIEHVCEPEKILKEISRLLNKRGSAIISIPHDYYLTNFVRMIFFNKPIIFEGEFGKKGTHIHFFTIKISKSLINKYFTIRKIKYFGHGLSVPLLNQKQKNLLTNLFPRIFASNVFFLVSKK